MITLVCNDDGFFVYNVSNWYEFRKKYRIVGHMIGTSFPVPSLPLKLQPDEAVLLVENGFAKLCKVTFHYNYCDSISAQMLNKFEEILILQQQLEYKERRKDHLESFVYITEKKWPNEDTESDEKICSEEIEKSVVVTKNSMIWPLFLSSKFLSNRVHTSIIHLNEILNITTNLKYKIFKDLWQRNYYITSGEKFGSDFLVYLGDPVLHHAVFMVRCMEGNRTITYSELIAFGRLGTAVKKTAVFGSEENDKITYLRVNWIDF